MSGIGGRAFAAVLLAAADAAGCTRAFAAPAISAAFAAPTTASASPRPNAGWCGHGTGRCLCGAEVVVAQAAAGDACGRQAESPAGTVVGAYATMVGGVRRLSGLPEWAPELGSDDLATV